MSVKQSDGIPHIECHRSRAGAPPKVDPQNSGCDNEFSKTWGGPPIKVQPSHLGMPFCLLQARTIQGTPWLPRCWDALRDSLSHQRIIPVSGQNQVLVWSQSGPSPSKGTSAAERAHAQPSRGLTDARCLTMRGGLARTPPWAGESRRRTMRSSAAAISFQQGHWRRS